jgi:hypothetical protein
VLGFEASLGKRFARPYVEKKPLQKRAPGVAQGGSPEFKTQHRKKNNYSQAGEEEMEVGDSPSKAGPGQSMKNNESQKG